MRACACVCAFPLRLAILIGFFLELCVNGERFSSRSNRFPFVKVLPLLFNSTAFTEKSKSLWSDCRVCRHFYFILSLGIDDDALCASRSQNGKLKFSYMNNSAPHVRNVGRVWVSSPIQFNQALTMLRSARCFNILTKNNKAKTCTRRAWRLFYENSPSCRPTHKSHAHNAHTHIYSDSIYDFLVFFSFVIILIWSNGNKTINHS